MDNSLRAFAQQSVELGLGNSSVMLSLVASRHQPLKARPPLAVCSPAGLRRSVSQTKGGDRGHR